MQPSCNPEKTYGPRTFSNFIPPKRESITQFKRFRLLPFRSPLLRESTSAKATADNSAITLEKDYFFLFLRLLRCFNSPGTCLTVLCVQTADVPPSAGQVSPFGNPRIKGCLPPNRGLSQAATSFISFLCQGIHHIHLLRFSHIFISKKCFILIFCKLRNKIYKIFIILC